MMFVVEDGNVQSKVLRKVSRQKSPASGYSVPSRVCQRI
jgi:hypothetical protein